MVTAWMTVALLVLITTAFAVHRAIVDSANIRSGRLPPAGDFDRRYAQHPVLAYLHIVPGVIFMVGAPLQFVPWIRRRHLRWHRRLGRVFLVSGLVAGLFAIVIGIVFPFGGAVEAAATVTFGSIFVFALARAFLHVRAGNVAAHREWMIRAFALGLGVSTIRLWIPVLQSLTDMTFERSLGIAFWMAFTMHLAAAEIWIRRTRGATVPRVSDAVVR